MVPPTKMPPLAPFGPSEVLMAGMPFSGIDFVLQKSAAVSRDTYVLVNFGRWIGKLLLTFSSRVRAANFFRAVSRMSCRSWLF